MITWKRIGVIGAGTMGRGIAQIASQAGCEVVLVDASVEALESSEVHLQSIMHRLVEKGRISQAEADQVQFRIKRSGNLEELQACDMVIEAIVEDLDTKADLFSALENVMREDAVLATNTSSLSVTALASRCQHPKRVIGLHFFNPAPLMALVEVVPALQTDSQIVSAAMDEMESWGKAPALTKDTPGFIVNRVARPFYSEAIRILDEGLADATDIDASMRAHGFRMGPFELMDLIGHDVNYAVTSTVHAAFYGDSRYRPSHTQRQLVAANWLGRKSGRGFYEYESGVRKGASGRVIDGVAERILAMLMNEAADAIFWQIASATAIDLAMQKGGNYPKGLLEWADEWGLDRVVGKLDELRSRYGEERYRVSPVLRDLSEKGLTFFDSSSMAPATNEG